MPAISKSSRKKAAKPYDAPHRASSFASTSISTPLTSAVADSAATNSAEGGEKLSRREKKKRARLGLGIEKDAELATPLELSPASESGGVKGEVKEEGDSREIGVEQITGGNKLPDDVLSSKKKKKLEKKQRKRSSQLVEGLSHSQTDKTSSQPAAPHQSTSTSSDFIPLSSDIYPPPVDPDANDSMPAYLRMSADGDDIKVKKEKKREDKKKEAIQAIVQRQVQEQTQEIEACLRRDMERELEAMKVKIAELEAEVEKKQGELVKSNTEAEMKDEVIEQHEKVKEQLKEAVGCGVCFETLRDPHILSCGHVACRSCLQSWFRTPGAYVHEVPDPLPAEMNLEFFTKVCHVCRTYIVSRPSRMYHLQSILEPLGIDSHLPSASQTASEADIWKGMFPPEKDQYRIHDTSDHVDRCPQCFGEIDEGQCIGCEAEFSVVDEDVPDFNTEDGVDNGIEREAAHVDEDAVNDSDDSDNDLDSFDGSEADDWLDDDMADTARPQRGGAFREAMIAAREGRRDRHRARRESASGSHSPPRLPRGISNFLDVMADESDEDEMTDEDEGDEEIGERGDYPSGPDESDSEAAMARGDTESEGYEDSFIDDESVHDDVDGDILMDSSDEAAPAVRKARTQRSESVDSIASAPSIGELRRKRIQAMEQRSGAAAPRETLDEQEGEVSRPTRASRTRSRVIVVSDDDE